MIVQEKNVDFNKLEQKIFKSCCLLGCELLKTALETYDQELAAARDKKKYRNKGTRKTVMKCVMGEVEYSRNVYEFHDDEGSKRHVYLLDEAIGKDGSGFMSELLSEMIVKAACESTYRGASRSVSELTGQPISHTAAWKVVQELGERVDTQEKQAANAATANQGVGKLETPVLFEEQDGIWLNLQGKDRKLHGSSKEMKVAIAYDGTKQIGKKRYELTNKVACANFEPASKFQKRKEGLVAGTYNVDEIEIRLLNGDGAKWIRRAQTDETVHFQLDPFHRNKAIRTYVKNPEMREQMIEFLYNKDIDTLLDYIEACANSVEEKQEQENLETLWLYFTNNKDGLVPCHRRGLNLPEPPEGIEYRRMGAMESNIFTLIGNRMKGRRACWSLKGGNNLARLLCLKATKKLSETLQNLTTVALPVQYSEEIITILTPSKVAKSVGKGYNGYQKSLAPPTLDYKWLRDIGAVRSLLEF